MGERVTMSGKKLFSYTSNVGQNKPLETLSFKTIILAGFEAITQVLNQVAAGCIGDLVKKIIDQSIREWDIGHNRDI